MRRSVLLLVTIFFAMSVTSFSQTDNSASAKNFIDLFFKGEYAKAYEYFSDNVKAQLPLAAMPQVAMQFSGQLGVFKSQGGQTSAPADGLEKIVTACQFERGEGAIITAFNSSGKIEGFFYEPLKTAAKGTDAAFPGEQMTLKTSTGDIFGVLVVPESKEPLPVVIIHAGSGATDRDGNNPTGLNTDGYKMLAEELAKNGIASLRYDKRGIGMSRSSMAREADIRFDDYIDDLTGWCAKLRKDARFSSLVIAGHSEGSLIGMIAAERAGADGFISIAGAGRKLSDVLRTQLKPQLSEDDMKKADAALTALENGKTVKAIPGLESIFRESVQPYLISLFKYDPVKEIAKLKVPVIVIQGTSDVQVGVEDAKLLSKTPVLIEGMSHTLKQVGDDKESNRLSYANPKFPLDEKFVSEVVGFVKKIKSAGK